MMLFRRVVMVALLTACAIPPATAASASLAWYEQPAAAPAASPAAAPPATVGARPLTLPTFDRDVSALAIRGRTLYVGGAFTRAVVGGHTVARAGLAAIDLTSGTLLPWRPAANGRVMALAVSDAAVFVAGDFSTINGARRDSLAAVDPVSGANIAFTHGLSGRPYSLALGTDRLYLGGTLTSVDGVPVAGAAAFDLHSGLLDLKWAPQLDTPEVRTVAFGPQGVYLGGDFGSVDGASGTRNLALVDAATGAVRPRFVSGAAYRVNGVTVNGSSLYAAIAGPGGRIMAMDAATGAAHWTVTSDGDVVSAAVLDGVIYFGGHFDRVCRSSNVDALGDCVDGSDDRIKIAAVSGDGRLLDWSANGNGVVGVEALIADQHLGVITAGGAFTQINGEIWPRLAVFGRP